MDKLKTFFGHLKKHQLWLLTAVILITGLAGWYLATADLYAGTEAQKKVVQGSFTMIKGIDPEVPNPKWVTDFDKHTATAQKDVEATWNDLYKDQRDSVLKWPKELGKEFLDMIRSIGPNDEIPRDFRNVYFTYIKEVFPSLLKIIDAENLMDESARSSAFMRRQGGGEGGGIGGLGSGPRGRGGEGEGRGFMPRSGLAPQNPGATVAPVHDYIVEWDPIGQSRLVQMLEWQTTPTTHQVRIAQENLWVCEAILRVIAKVNANATGHHNAKIRRIEELQFGKDAASKFEFGTYGGKILRLEVDQSKLTSGEGRVPGLGGMPGPPRSMGGEAGIRGEQMFDEQSDANLEKGRYVDATGKVLETATDPEFKRMPIYLRLVMDQREVNRLLTECANSPLPIVVRQFRINPDNGGSVRSAMRSTATKRAAPHLRQIPGLNGPRPDEPPSPYEVFVELNGIIHIFNPPPEPKAKANPAQPDATEAPDGAAQGKSAESGEPAIAAPDAPVETAPKPPAEPATAEAPAPN